MATDIKTVPRMRQMLRLGVVLALLITAVDVIGMIAVGLPNAPVEVNIITTVLAAATVVGAVFAWHGAAWGAWVAAISRGVSALSIIPIVLVPDAPKDAIPLSVVVVVLTVVAIVLLLAGRPRRQATT